MGDVEVHRPCNVLRADDVAVEVYFDTAVHHVANIVVVAIISQRGRNRKPQQHVGGFALIELHATRKSALKQFKFKASVYVGVGFPRDVSLTFVAESQRALAVYGQQVVEV